jgi:hypothetical protein
MKSESPWRWRFKLRFGLRTFFVVVTLVCAAAAWVQSQRRWIRERHEIVATYRVLAGPILHGHKNPMYFVYGARPEVPWQLRFFGEKGYYEVMLSDEMSDRDFRQVEKLFPEAKVTRMWLKESFARRSAEDEVKIREQFRTRIQ